MQESLGMQEVLVLLVQDRQTHRVLLLLLLAVLYQTL
jgi:hypothetical protein